MLAACGSGPSSTTSGIPKGPIKIGALLGLSGPFASIGVAQQALNGALVNNLNSQGGIDGHRVTLVTLNDQGDPAVAVAQAQQLVQDHVAGVIYAGTSATVNQTVPVLEKARIPIVMLDPLDQWSNGTKYPYFFDNYPLNKPTMSYMVTFAKDKGVTKLGVIGDGTSFFQQLDADLVPAAEAQHLPITATVSYSPTAVDVTTQVRELQASGANGIALLAEAGLGSVYNAMREIGWTTPTILTTAAATIVGYTSLGSLASNAYANCTVALKAGQQPDPSLAHIMQVVEAKIGVTPFATAAPIYNDDFLILKDAITKANSLSGPAIKNQIEHMTDVSFTSPQFRYTFTPTDHDGWPKSEIYMCRLTAFGPYDLPIIANP
jgi:branched-chain amino acid transport system substrate-binding protein